jgi:hypothetical protein
MSATGDDRPGTDEGPGGRLRHEREERGLTVQQVAEELKLDAAVIIALEQNDFPSLGAPVFARGHLRTVRNAARHAGSRGAGGL